jgi:hypothetical protein
MMDPTPPPTFRNHPALRTCTILCLTALLVMVLALLENDRDLIWILILALIGAVALLAKWRFGPPLLLAGLIVLEFANRVLWSGYGGRLYGWADSSPFMDATLAAAFLVFAAGQYRIVSVVHSVLPPDVRRRPPPPPPGPPNRIAKAPEDDGRHRRSADLISQTEMAAMLVAAVVWAGVAVGVWLGLSALTPPHAFSRGVWRGLMLIFLGAATLAVLSAVAGYWSWITSTPEEHLLYLQDEAWRDTRLEQSSLNRWLVWARLRAQRRKEKS